MNEQSHQISVRFHGCCFWSSVLLGLELHVPHSEGAAGLASLLRGNYVIVTDWHIGYIPSLQIDEASE